MKGYGRAQRNEQKEGQGREDARYKKRLQILTKMEVRKLQTQTSTLTLSANLNLTLIFILTLTLVFTLTQTLTLNIYFQANRGDEVEFDAYAGKLEDGVRVRVRVRIRVRCLCWQAGGWECRRAGG